MRARSRPAPALRPGPDPADGRRCAMVQTCFCIFSVFLWPVLSRSAICGGIPHLAELVSTYLIIFNSAWPKLPISLQASSGGALRSLAALISLARFSASSRKGANPFVQASDRLLACATPRKHQGGSKRRRPVHVRNLAKRCWRALRPGWERRWKRVLRECLPGVKGHDGQRSGTIRRRTGASRRSVARRISIRPRVLRRAAAASPRSSRGRS